MKKKSEKKSKKESDKCGEGLSFILIPYYYSEFCNIKKYSTNNNNNNNNNNNIKKKKVLFFKNLLNLKIISIYNCNNIIIIGV